MEEVKKDVQAMPPKKGVDKQKFIAKKLKDINNLSNKALAEFLAAQVLKNK